MIKSLIGLKALLLLSTAPNGLDLKNPRCLKTYSLSYGPNIRFGLDLFAQVILNFFLDVECGGVVGGGKTTVGHELNVLKSPGGNPW